MLYDIGIIFQESDALFSFFLVSYEQVILWLNPEVLD